MESCFHLNSLLSCMLTVCIVVVCMQFVNPYHLWQLWSPAVRHQRYCLARHNQLIGDKVRRLMKEPPAPHTIAGTPCCIAYWPGLFETRSCRLWKLLKHVECMKFY